MWRSNFYIKAVSKKKQENKAPKPEAVLLDAFP